MKKRVLKFYRWILALLGFATVSASCDDRSGSRMVCMYGVPTMDYKVSGKVVGKSLDPVEGIEVSCSSSYGGTTVLSGADGAFTLADQAFPSDTLKVTFKDIDGVQNGSYRDTTVSVALKKVKSGDSSWNLGEYEASGVEVRLVEK